MSDRRSFWSTVPGLITGLAGLLTGIVGLVTVLIQLGVIGGKSDGTTTAATGGTVTTTAPSTAPGSAPSTVAAGGTTVTAAGSFTVPATLDFPVGVKEKPLPVKNTSTSGSITVRPPTVTGKDAAQFSASLGDCSQPLAAGLSCTMTVTFSPNGPLRTYSATLQVTATGAARGAEVALTASTLL